MCPRLDEHVHFFFEIAPSIYFGEGRRTMTFSGRVLILLLPAAGTILALSLTSEVALPGPDNRLRFFKDTNAGSAYARRDSAGGGGAHARFAKEWGLSNADLGNLFATSRSTAARMLGRDLPNHNTPPLEENHAGEDLVRATPQSGPFGVSSTTSVSPKSRKFPRILWTHWDHVTDDFVLQCLRLLIRTNRIFFWDHVRILYEVMDAAAEARLRRGGLLGFFHLRESWVRVEGAEYPTRGPELAKLIRQGLVAAGVPRGGGPCFEDGQWVRLRALEKQPGLNGAIGVVIRGPLQNGRFSVRVVGRGMLSVRAENLEVFRFAEESGSSPSTPDNQSSPPVDEEVVLPGDLWNAPAFDFDSLQDDEVDAPRLRRTRRSDLLRLALLEKYGGLWVDASTLVFHGLDWVRTEIENKGLDFLGQLQPAHWIVNGERDRWIGNAASVGENPGAGATPGTTSNSKLEGVVPRLPLFQSYFAAAPFGSAVVRAWRRRFHLRLRRLMAMPVVEELLPAVRFWANSNTWRFDDRVRRALEVDAGAQLNDLQVFGAQ